LRDSSGAWGAGVLPDSSQFSPRVGDERGPCTPRRPGHAGAARRPRKMGGRAGAGRCGTTRASAARRTPGGGAGGRNCPASRPTGGRATRSAAAPPTAGPTARAAGCAAGPPRRWRPTRGRRARTGPSGAGACAGGGWSTSGAEGRAACPFLRVGFCRIAARLREGIMPRSCTICGHERRAQIDAALHGGRSAAAIAATFRVSEDAVQRHKQRHATPPPVAKENGAPRPYAHKAPEAAEGENHGNAECTTRAFSRPAFTAQAPPEPGTRHAGSGTAVPLRPPGWLCSCGRTAWGQTSIGAWACRSCGMTADPRFAPFGRDLSDCRHERVWRGPGGRVRCDLCRKDLA
jgi:hypothetical protein